MKTSSFANYSQYNILIIGFGKRVTNTILPAVNLLNKNFNLIGIYSRKKYKYNYKNKKYVTEKNLNNINFSSINIIIVAITTDNVPDLLLSLSLVKQNLSHITLYLDTPVFNLKHLWASGYLRYFKSIHVTEDYISMTNLRQIKKNIKIKKLGKIKNIHLIHSGYRYHALAMIKYLTSQNSVRKITVQKNNLSIFQRNIKLHDGSSATIIEPRDYNVGKILVTCQNGSIADYQLTGKNVSSISYRYKNKFYEGLNLPSGLQSKANISLKKIKNFKPKIKDYSLINWLKIESLVNMIENTYTNKYKYHYIDGIYDNLMTELSEKYEKIADYKIPTTNFTIIYLITNFITSLFQKIPIKLITYIHNK